MSYVVPVKSKVEISQNFVAFWEYMNFTNKMNVLRENSCILWNTISLGTSNCQNDEQLLFMIYIFLT